MNDTPTVIGAFVTIILAFLGVAKIMLNQATKDRDADRKERKELSEAISLMAKSSNKVAEATVRSANEAKQRNGHLAELIITQGEMVKNIAESATDKIIGAVQHVDTQKVEHQVIKETGKE